jgi:hypothetical protein
MSTIGDTVTRAKRLLNSNTRTELDAIHTAITASSGTIRLKYQTDGIRAGSYISVGDNTQGYETMYVYARNGEYATVERGVAGSTALAFTADIDDADVVDTAIEVEPRFSGFQILEAIRDAIRALPENLYAVDTLQASFSTGDSAVSITLPSGDSNGFYQILAATRTARSGEDRLLKFNVKVQEYDGAYTLIRQEAIEKTVTANLTYAHPFVTGTLDLDTILTTTVKMPVSMQDIPALGAAASLVLSEEASRLDLHAAGSSTGDAASSPGDRTRYSLVLQAQYDRRIGQEARRLMAKYGIRTDGVTTSVYPTSLRAR